MPRSSLRASRPSGVPSGQVDRGAPLAARSRVNYWCNADHLTTLTLDAAAEVPTGWECGTCGSPAQRERGTAPPDVRPRVFPRSPYEFLMMRRTVEEGEELLARALADVRRRRVSGDLA